MNNFLANNRLAVVEAAATAGQTTLDSDVVDMAGFDGVTFVALLGDVTVDSVLTLTLQHGDEVGGGDMESTAIVATHTATASDADSKILVVEGYMPTKRYARARLARGTANAVVGGIIAIMSGPKVAPVTQDATVISNDFGAPVVSA
jgi:hypothetical protein